MRDEEIELDINRLSDADLEKIARHFNLGVFSRSRGRRREDLVDAIEVCIDYEIPREKLIYFLVHHHWKNLRKHVRIKKHKRRLTKKNIAKKRRRLIERKINAKITARKKHTKKVVKMKKHKTRSERRKQGAKKSRKHMKPRKPARKRR